MTDQSVEVEALLQTVLEGIYPTLGHERPKAEGAARALAQQIEMLTRERDEALLPSVEEVQAIYTEVRLTDRILEVEAQRDRLAEALREIREIPSEHDLLFNAVAHAMYTLASLVLSDEKA